MGFFSLILDIINKPKKKGIESNPKDFKVLTPPTKKRRDNFHESRLSLKRRREKYFSSDSLTPEEQKCMKEYRTNISKNEKLKIEENISKGQMWLGMTREQLIFIKGIYLLKVAYGNRVEEVKVIKE